MAKVKEHFDHLAAVQGLLLVVVAIIALEATGLIQAAFSQRIIREEANRNAHNQMEIAELRINGIVEEVQTAVRNNLWSAREQVSNPPDSLWNLAKGIVEDNDIICGSAIALVENYNRKAGRMFAPYACRRGEEIELIQLGTEEYDYFSREWFTNAFENPGGYWSEPYFDEGGANQLITTYSIPVTDHLGNVAAVLTADLSLDWLTELLDGIQMYPNSFNLMFSRAGKTMVCPVDSFVMRGTMNSFAENANADLTEVREAMQSGKSGVYPAQLRGKKYYVFFNPIDTTGWAMSIAIPEDEIYSSLKRTETLVFFLQVIGILLLILILWYTFSSQKKMREVTLKKERIENELQVASDIQMSMLPKIFPPFPEREDVDMFAAIRPAKEVGGDLYDFFIQNDALYFCVGDVSGKGIPASLVMAVTRSLFRTVSAHEKSPERIVNNINQSIASTNENDMFVTLFCAVLDLNNGHLRYCNAGHNAPFLLRGDKVSELPVIPNLPIGIEEKMHFREQEMDLAPGDGIFLFTDGLNEAENIHHAQFGNERIVKLLDGSLKAEKQVARMMDAVSAFVGDANQSDDLTLLYLRFTNDKLDQCMERHLILHNDIQQIPQLADFVQTVGDLAHMDVGMTMSLNLALEEAVANVILYAYPAGSDGLVDIEAVIRPESLTMIITDSGVPFDPTQAPEADVTLSAEDRPIGGLGIFLIRNIMDTVEYQRTNDKNILTMTKKLA